LTIDHGAEQTGLQSVAGRLCTMRSVAILGATGSVGAQALEIVRDSPDLRLVALSAHSSSGLLLDAAREHGVELLALTDADAAATARGDVPGRLFEGRAGLVELVRAAGADVVLNAVVGAAGLEATMAALESGSDLALANKESLVAGGDLVTAAARRSGRRLLPVDSEHSAL
jgi:1-deoxy-D-xylulose-5-phosphate reductoisomerase